MRLACLLVVLLMLGAAALALHAFARERPQDVPWTRLDLARPIGAFTQTKLARLKRDAPLCRALLDEAGIDHVALPARRAPPSCGYADGIRLAAGRTGAPDYRPADLGTSCAVAAALVIWEREIVQPAAERRFGRPVAAIDHFGSYSCRRIAGRSRRWSEHATGNAVDIAGFRLASGRRITVARDWSGDDAEARFLREVRDGACRLFATTLSPDYNAAHRDHFHLDQADRGPGGWRACR